MEDNNIDMIGSTKIVKMGDFGSVDITGKTQQEITSNLDKAYVHNLSYSDYRLQSNVPEHINASNLFGTQIRKLIMKGVKKVGDYSHYVGGNLVNLGTKRGLVKLTGENLVKFYNSLISANILESYKEFEAVASNPEKVSRVLTQMTLNNDRESKDNLNAFELDDDNNPTSEFKVTNDDPPIFGWGDAMLNVDNEEVIGEIKTMKAESFEHYKIKGEPADYHVKQLIIYMKVLKKSKGVLIYENKNNHDLLAFPIEVTPKYKEWIDNTFEWMRVVYKSWKDKQLPQKNYRANSKICKNCPVKAVCATAEPGVVKIKSLEGFSETV